ncbi:MAG: UDP-3-O-acyl-N-acetylglucosamine deacetylase, partial [Candidatus Eisenbacteria bacterium]|nr:UDP-3-O-acyl-N-acetylglucosamine deacetylase [Candidatus Eisenbacteria bacterium]
MSERQRTLASAISYEGVGLHTGENCQVTFKPAPPDSGIQFVRSDLPGKPKIRVVAENAVYDSDQGRRTILREGEAEVHTVEHLLAAATGCGIDNLTIELNAREPGHTIDGSATPFVEMFQKAGIEVQAKDRRYFEVPHPVRFAKGGAEVLGFPHEALRISFTIEFEHPVIGTQHAVFDIEPEVFLREIAPARTFVLREDVEKLQKAGMIKGGSLDTAVV